MARILIIDDNDQVRLSLRMALEDAGHSVEEAADGIAGLQIFRKNPADLIITDLVMPNKDGFETISDLKKDSNETKIIAISGDCDANPGSYLFTAKAMGASQTFEKPINLAELIDAIEKLLEE